ncbi:hypothetical protein F5Y15DRAFT_419768 [Xylariaceae sp. FL0016]|nr:hypothetical protein F5Y15DRAFT_419768 [Xylariaceae sp. FL0016]
MACLPQNDLVSQYVRARTTRRRFTSLPTDMRLVYRHAGGTEKRDGKKIEEGQEEKVKEWAKFLVEQTLNLPSVRTWYTEPAWQEVAALTPLGEAILKEIEKTHEDLVRRYFLRDRVDVWTEYRDENLVGILVAEKYEKKDVEKLKEEVDERSRKVANNQATHAKPRPDKVGEDAKPPTSNKDPKWTSWGRRNHFQIHMNAAEDQALSGFAEDNPFWQLSDMAVLATERKKGIGKALVKQLQDQASQDGLPILVLSKSTAKEFYEKCNFEEIDKLVLASPPEDALTTPVLKWAKNSEGRGGGDLEG